MSPKVTFIVPCYKLALLLAECVNSILSQTYRDFEILIMDDCSPDNTPEVARSFQDSRVKHIRNEPNLRHLRNYNKGIGLAGGEYIWLISADDSLRSPQVLERYVQLMDNAPNVGFVFCPATKVVDGRDLGVMPYSLISPNNMVIRGHKFLEDHLVFANIVPSPAAMARKKCYEQISLFPLDLPHTGDWYLWAMFALYFDVGFFAESMVNRRFHEANMSGAFCKDAVLPMFANNLAVPLRLLERCKKEGFGRLAESCRRGVAAEYLRQVIPPKPGDIIQASLTDEEFENSLRMHISDPKSHAAISARVYGHLADYYYEQGDLLQGLRYYRTALRHNAFLPKVWAKYLLLGMGAFGSVLREGLVFMKHQVTSLSSTKSKRQEQGAKLGVSADESSSKHSGADRAT